MDAAAILDTLRADGFSVDCVGDKLIVAPASRITDALRADIKAHKAELVALVGTVAANDPHDPARDAWRITTSAGERFSSMFCPPKSRAEVLALYPNADVEPEPEPLKEPERLASDVLAIAYAYLDHIGEHCPIERTGFIVGLERSAKQHPERLQWLYGEAVRMGLAVWEGAV